MRSPIALLALALTACGPSSLGPRGPSQGATAPAAQVAPFAERVRFPSRDDDLTHGAATMIDALLFKPTGAGPFPAVVALHGCAGLYAHDGRLTARHEEWALRLREQGYVVVMPDSFNPRGVPEICKKSDRTIRAGFERARDAYGALLYLQSQPFVKADRVGLLGWSNGAITALWTIQASSHARPHGLPNDFRVAVAFYPKK